MKMLNKLQKSTRVKIVFFILGISSIIWFLIRVIPKPGRASYPCMRVVAPVMSGFILYLITLAGSVYTFRKAIERFFKLKYLSAMLFFIAAIIFTLTFFTADTRNALATINLASLETPNTPMGVGKGIFPGRVVWVMDKTSTNEECSNSDGDYWFMNENTNQAVVKKMLADGMKAIAGQNSVAGSWDAVFKYFNNAHGKGSVGYKSGEKVVIKINLTTMGNGDRNLNEAMDATPQVVFALLEQLVDTVKIAQADISLGDPYRNMPDEIYNPCFTKYPNVHYIEGVGTEGREQTTISTNNVFFTSDNKFSSRLPQAYLDAAYLINLPCLKTHNSAGITIAAKNHQGSVIGTGQDATSQYMYNYLHYDYPVDGGPANQKMKVYRHLTDYMAHSKLGGNTLIYIVDAIWSGRNWNAQVDKWGMPPFNDDWTSSLFISQDAVAIESVGFDFLYNEYKDYPEMHGDDNFPLVAGVQDYIHQAADPANWPAGIKYDPNISSHSNPVGSLGVHEHWNNTTLKQYSRNLSTGDGIELFGIPSSLVGGPVSAKGSSINNSGSLNIVPNPLKDIATLKYSLKYDASVHVEILSMDGRLVAKSGNIKQHAGNNSFVLNVLKYKLNSGTYNCTLYASGTYSSILTAKILIQ
jgi:hypothetical protein